MDVQERMMEDDEAVLDLQDAFEEDFHVNASTLKKFELATGKFEDVIANAMMFKQNPELGTFLGENDDEVLNSVNHVIGKMDEPFGDSMEEGANKPMTYFMPNVSMRGSGSLVAKPSTKSTKTTKNDKVMKRSSTKQNTLTLSSAAIEALGSMVQEMEENRQSEPVVPTSSVTQKPYVNRGILLRHIDEEYEFDDDDNPIAH
ncbi:hypothetical protein BDZ45DRAFT_768597 [Acephala macrosclerotiorum]|nr:hypothetical protein BDZ45DRAFT_768597 [Acephala macrosclerotiorum]